MFALLTGLLARQRPVQAPVTGSRLSRIGRGAWAADRDLVYGRNGRMPLRMVVLEHEPGQLTLYSPVGLDGQTVEALAGLGTVSRIIAPNRFHTLFVGQAMDTFPDARLLLPPTDGGLGARFPRRSEVLTGEFPPTGATEVRLVRWREGLEEVIVYHDPAELLVVCDLVFNLHSPSGLQRRLAQLNGIWQRPAQSRLQKWLLLRDRRSLDEFYHWAMGKPFSQISMAHGELMTTGAREHFYRLLGPASSR